MFGEEGVLVTVSSFFRIVRKTRKDMGRYSEKEFSVIARCMDIATRGIFKTREEIEPMLSQTPLSNQRLIEYMSREFYQLEEEVKQHRRARQSTIQVVIETLKYVPQEHRQVLEQFLQNLVKDSDKLLKMKLEAKAPLTKEELQGLDNIISIQK